MSLLAGKKGLILGVANKHSIAWSIAQAAHEYGAELGFTYLDERLERRVRPLAEELKSSLILECNVTDDEALEKTFAEVKNEWGSLDFVVHSIAFAQREDLAGRFIDTSRQGFLTAMEISAFSLVSVAKHAAPLMTDGGSILTMTYHGSQKVVPNYNVMGVAKAALEASVRYLAEDLGPDNIRVNALSAGPVKTLSAKGISGFNTMMHKAEEVAPLRRNITVDEVGKASVFFLSDLSSGVTGECTYVDSGYNIKAM